MAARIGAHGRTAGGGVGYVALAERGSVMARRSAAWKAHERAVAQAFGGVRSGNRGASAADVVSDWLVAECKERASLPAWLEAAMVQAETAAAGYVGDRLPVVVLHELGRRRVDDLVVVRAGAFREWFGSDGLGDG